MTVGFGFRQSMQIYWRAAISGTRVPSKFTLLATLLEDVFARGSRRRGPWSVTAYQIRRHGTVMVATSYPSFQYC